MKTNKLMIFIVIIILIVNFTTINVLAETGCLEDDLGITPQYTTIILCSNNLTLNAGGKLTCEEKTNVQRGYIAGVKMELQELSDDWITIKTWDFTSDGHEAYLFKDWYVARGSYRLKLIHTAIDSSNKIVETVIKYSKTVIY